MSYLAPGTPENVALAQHVNGRLRAEARISNARAFLFRAIGLGVFLGLAGAGLGGCFALSMIVALDHLPDPAEAGALSALMQGGGFLITAAPPWIVAVLHDATGSFVAGWLLHLACVVVVAALYWRVTPASYAGAMKSPAEVGREAVGG